MYSNSVISIYFLFITNMSFHLNHEIRYVINYFGAMINKLIPLCNYSFLLSFFIMNTILYQGGATVLNILENLEES